MTDLLKPTQYGVESVGQLVRFTFGNITITCEPATAFDLSRKARAAASRSVQYAGGGRKEINILANLTDATEDLAEWQRARDATAAYLTDGNAEN